MKNKDYCLFLAVLALKNLKLKGDNVAQDIFEEDIKDAVEYLNGLNND